MSLPRIVILLAVASALSACGGSGGLHRFAEIGSGPEEFAALPSRSLEMPASYDRLPPPAPGAANRADPAPVADAVAALGGRPGALVPGAVPAADAALVAQAARHGVTPGIRATLAQEDAAVRGRRFGGAGGLLSGAGPYFSTYSRQALDAYAELQRFRAAEVRTPSAPPGP